MPELGIRLIGVNEVGHESGNAQVCEDRDIPWLQETADLDIWALWAVTYRDVVILDRANVPVAVFNLTDNNLSEPADYDALRALLIGIASSP